MNDSSVASLAVRHRLLLLALIGLMLYVPSLGLHDLWYPDEPDIGEVCKAMYESGDWVAPRRVGVIWVDYPPMLYWVGTISSHALGGVSEFALRLPNALAAVALVLLTCLVGSRWFGANVGFWAGFTLLTFQQYVQQAIGYRPDVLFSLAIAAGFFAYAAGSGPRGRWTLRVAGFAFFGLAMLAKGPLGLLLPGLVLTLWLGSRREWRRFFELAPLALVSMAVYLPWFVACARAMGSDSILYELYAQNIARFFAGDRGHAQPIYYYLTNIWGDLWPWSLLLPFAFVSVVRGERLREARIQLLLWWVGAFFAFLTLAVTKRQLYFLPAYPAMALVLGLWIATAVDNASNPRFERPVRWLAIAVAMLFAALAVTCLGAVVFFDDIVAKADFDALETEAANGIRWPLALLGVVIALVAVWIIGAWRQRQARSMLVRIGAGHVVVYFVLLMFVLPPLNPIRTYRPQSEWIRDTIGDSTHFGLYNPDDDMAFRKKGGFAHYSGRLVDVLDDRDAVNVFFDQYPSSVVLVETDAALVLFSGDEAAWRSRVIRELPTGGYDYLVVGAPAGGIEGGELLEETEALPGS